MKKKLSGGQPNNKNGVKLKESTVRQDAYTQYCDHLSKGKSQESFCFEHDLFTVTYKTMNKYIEDNPLEFPPIKKEIALIKGFNKWEEITEISARGEKIDNCTPNTASLQMVMRNKFGWDKKDPDKKIQPDELNLVAIKKALKEDEISQS